MSNKIQENFDFFKKIEQETNPNTPLAVQIHSVKDFNTIILEKNENGVPIAGKTIINDDDFLNYLNPDNTNVQEFWEKVMEYYPGEAIAGYRNKETESNFIDNLNQHTFEYLHKNSGALYYIDDLFQNIPNANFLEIGCGYGNIINYITKNYPTANIFATDVVQLINHPNFVITDGWSIPNELKKTKMDMVYANNVFQLLSENQRLAYYKDVYDILNSNGKFIFGMNMITEDNKNSNLWGTQDKYGNYYTRFFNQFTIAPHIDNVYETLYNIGFTNINYIKPYDDVGVYITLEITKK